MFCFSCQGSFKDANQKVPKHVPHLTAEIKTVCNHKNRLRISGKRLCKMEPTLTTNNIRYVHTLVNFHCSVRYGRKRHISVAEA